MLPFRLTFCVTSATRIGMNHSILFLLFTVILQVQLNLAIVTNQSKYSMSFVCFRCNHCKGEYRSQRAYDSHRTHVKSLGSPCNDPVNKKSVSYTERAYLSTGILVVCLPCSVMLHDNVCGHRNVHAMAVYRRQTFICIT